LTIVAGRNNLHNVCSSNGPLSVYSIGDAQMLLMNVPCSVLNPAPVRRWWRMMLPASLLLAFVGSHARADILEYSRGHADIGYQMVDGRISLGWKFEEGDELGGQVLSQDTFKLPGQVYARVADSAGVVRPAGSGWDVLGVAEGEAFFRLPARSVPDLPHLGLSTDAAPQTANLRWTLLDYRTPTGANFTLYTTPGIGQISALWATSDHDRFNDFGMSWGTHNHYNWAFTDTGVYDLTLQLSGDLAGEAFAAAGTFRFVVGSSTAVPEPSSWLLAAVASGVVVLRKRLQRRKRAG